MYKSLTFLSLILVLCFSCKEPADTQIIADNYTTLEVKSDNNNQVRLNQLIDDIQFVALENTQESLISRISKIFEYGDTYVIFDDTMNKIAIFSKDGDFIRTIGGLGSGPGEFSNLTDIAINQNTGTIQAIDIDNYKILNYDMDGNYTHYFEVKDPLFYMSNLNSEYLGYWLGYFSEDFHNFKMTDSENKFLAQKFEFPNDPSNALMKFSFTGHLTNYGDAFLYSEAASSRVFEIKPEGETRVKYKFDFKKDPWPEDEMYKHVPFFQKVQKGQVSFLQKYEENDDALVFNYNHSVSDMPDRFPSNIKLGIYDKRNDQVYTHFNFKDDPLYETIRSHRGKSKNGEYFISKIHYSKIDIDKIREDGGYQSVIEKLDKVSTIQGIDPESMILVLYKFK